MFKIITNALFLGAFFFVHLAYAEESTITSSSYVWSSSYEQWTVGQLQEALQPFKSQKKDYTVIAKLGAGSFGEVFSVKDRENAIWALKRFKEEGTAEALREYKVGQALKHSSIVKAVDLLVEDRENGNSFLLMELVKGKTLSRIKKKSFSNKQAVSAILQFLRGIKYALGHQMLHMDLHAGNVMLDKHATLKIIDLSGFLTSQEVLNYLFNGYSESDGYYSKYSSKAPQILERLKGVDFAFALSAAHAAHPAEEAVAWREMERFFAMPTAHYRSFHVIANGEASSEESGSDETIGVKLWFKKLYFNRIMCIVADTLKLGRFKPQEGTKIRKSIESIIAKQRPFDDEEVAGKDLLRAINTVMEEIKACR